MKLRYLSIIIISSLFIASCNSDKTDSASGKSAKDGSAPGYTVETVVYEDSVQYGDCKAVVDCTIGYLKPNSEQAVLVDNINAWIRYALGNTAGAKMGEPLAKDVVDKALEGNADDLEEWNENFGYPPMTYEISYEVKPLVLEPEYVTMMFSSYVYLGGAHGESAQVGQTFVASTGQMLGDDIFRPDSEKKILALVKNGLMKQYFDVDNEKEFYDCLLSDNGEFALPTNAPYFTDKGVCFQYQQYEIAPYSAGMPECVIPFSSIKPYLTDAVADLIQ